MPLSDDGVPNLYAVNDDFGECFCGYSDGVAGHDEIADSEHCHHQCYPHFRESEPSSSSYASYSSYATCETNSDKLRRVIQAAVKGFSIGAGLKGGLSLFSLLARLSRRRSPNSYEKSSTLTNAQDIKLAVKEALRYCLFVGSFSGTFVSVDEIIAALEDTVGLQGGGL
ncbi:hypothetical protein Ancab_038450 [Ancistrocladus abbreviatus]